MDEPRSERDGVTTRVTRAHAQARTTLRCALGFVAAAAAAALAGAASWLPLHLFLAGGLVLAISGMSVMLTVTWSTAAAPDDRLVALQRSCVALGAGGVAVARELALGAAFVLATGAVYVAGLLLLMVLLVTTAAHGVQRRFDPAVFAYVLALIAGTAGVAIGVVMATGSASSALRATHVSLNLLGLVGLVIIGTLPFFAATVVRSRMAPVARPVRLIGVVVWQAIAVGVAATGAALEARAVIAVGLVAYAIGIAFVLALLPRPTRRQLRWAGPRLVALWAGALWWAAALVGATLTLTGDAALLDGRWLGALVVAGYAQILWGSLAYLLPMLRGGGHELLAEGFATTRSWWSLLAANAAGVAFVASAPVAAGAAIAVWVLDSGARAIAVGLGARRARAT